jgi:hypothetical protein
MLIITSGAKQHKTWETLCRMSMTNIGNNLSVIYLVNLAFTKDQIWNIWNEIGNWKICTTKNDQC